MDFDIVSTFTDPMNLAMMLAAVATFATVLTLAAPVMSSDKLTSRRSASETRR
jgi:hypothetical protein